MTYSVQAAAHGLFLYLYGGVCSVYLGFFLWGFLFVVKIVVTSLWAKAKSLFGCLILLAWLVVVFLKKKKKNAYKQNQSNPPKIFCRNENNNEV